MSETSQSRPRSDEADPVGPGCDADDLDKVAGALKTSARGRSIAEDPLTAADLGAARDAVSPFDGQHMRLADLPTSCVDRLPQESRDKAAHVHVGLFRVTITARRGHLPDTLMSAMVPGRGRVAAGSILGIRLPRV